MPSLIRDGENKKEGFHRQLGRGDSPQKGKSFLMEGEEEGTLLKKHL
jgi:hypothetical protein